MHPEDEGIYETADPDRGSNTRGETPDCERYCKTLRHTKNSTASLVAIIYCHRDMLSAHICITPSITNPMITYISQIRMLHVLSFAKKRMNRNMDKTDIKITVNNVQKSYRTLTKGAI